MEIYSDFFSFKTEHSTAVTVGKFDGLHRGHELLLNRILSKEPSLRSCMITFPVSPRSILGKADDKNLITPEERRVYLKKRDLSYLVEAPFDEKFMHLKPDEFVLELVNRFHMKYMVCGDDFTFGEKGRGDVSLLMELSKKFGFELEAVPKLKEDSLDISSTRIRKELVSGNVNEVKNLLGYPYFIWGKIVHGNHIGTGMGIPTINQIPPDNKLIPKNGVYITEVEIGSHIYHGISNVGVKPTVSNEGKVNVETYILDFKEDVYDREARVIFLEFIRPEKKFSGLDELSKQIRKDMKTALSYFNDDCK